MAERRPVGDHLSDEAVAPVGNFAEDALRRGEPEPGVKCASWRPPAAWGRVIHRKPRGSPPLPGDYSPVWKRPIEVLTFEDGHRLRRFLRGINECDFPGVDHPGSGRYTETVERLSPRELSWLCQCYGIERTTKGDREDDPGRHSETERPGVRSAVKAWDQRIPDRTCQ